MRGLRNRLARLSRALPCYHCGNYPGAPEPVPESLTPEERADVLSILRLTAVTCPVCKCRAYTEHTAEMIELLFYARELKRKVDAGECRNPFEG